MNIEKPVLTREQAEHLEDIKNTFDAEDILAHRFLGGNELLCSIPAKDCAIAIFHDYEVERTPGEELKERLKDHKDHKVRATDEGEYNFHSGAVIGINTAIDILDIKIEGINKDASE